MYNENDDNGQLPVRQKAMLLASGTLLSFLAHYRWGVPLLSWFWLVPFLVFTLKAKGWKDWGVLFVVLQVTLNLTTAKIVTEPIPVFFAFIFGVPAAFSMWLLLFCWNYMRKQIARKWWIPLFVAIAMISDWISFESSSFGMWGTAAVSQVDNLRLLQIASLGGISLISGLMAAVSIWAALVLVEKDKNQWFRSGIVIVLLLTASLLYGSWRIFSIQDGETVKVAAITTDVHLNPGLALPDKKELAIGEDSLFDRSYQAVHAGAKLIVWNEGATLVFPEDEEAFLKRASQFSKENSVDLVVAYIVLLSENPFAYDNKFVWFDDAGKELETYRKHHPVPGEPCIAGEGELLVHNRPWGSGTGAICYDYDFPSMAREQGRKSAGVAVVPSSDWLGIDPYHTRMTRIRAIEGGFSVVRPVRWATSEAYDAYGRIRASMPYFEGNRVMIADVPVTPIDTPYSRFGDWPVLIAGLVFLLSIIELIKGMKRKKG